MGWLYMKSLDGHRDPRQYLDAQFTYDRPDRQSRVVRSALVRMHVYYAAVETVRNGGQREVWAAVCLIRYNRRDREGYIFGYKDMDETVGPCECDCPEAILDLLMPTDREHAVTWRAACRTAAAARTARRAKPTARPGQIIVFDQAVGFSDGKTFQRMDVIANPYSHRTVLFRAPDSGALYRIPNYKARTYTLLEPAAANTRGDGKSATPRTAGGSSQE